jgi:N-acetylmuramoyl-L-alanine amidase
MPRILIPTGARPEARRRFEPPVVAVLLLVACCPPAAATDFSWEVRQFDGRDHVGVAQVAEFYGLRPVLPTDPVRPAFARGNRSLLFNKNSREAVINGLKHWLSFPVTQRDGGLWISRLDLSCTIEPALRPELSPGLTRPATVVLDPGHGGRDKGAINHYQFEKNFVLDVARRIRDELTAAGVKVFMTRNSDTYLDLPRRAALAGRQADSILVSIHFNAAANRAAQGFEVFAITPRGAPSTEHEDLSARDMVAGQGNAFEIQSYLLAKSVYHAMHGRLRMMDRGIKRARFAVLRRSKMPGVLIEGGFMSNPVDARRIASPRWRTRYAKAVAEGILAYIELAGTRKAPPLAGEYRIPGMRPPRLPPALPKPTPAPKPPVGLRGLPDEKPQEP